jgi:RNA polymerase sigma factor (sigma-70 family)
MIACKDRLLVTGRCILPSTVVINLFGRRSYLGGFGALGYPNASAIHPAPTRHSTRNGVGAVTEVHTVDTDPPWEGLTGPERHAACVHAARAGNRTALNTLVGELTPLLWHVTRGFGLDRFAAEDVVQTVWLALFSNLHRLAEPRAVAKWLITTTQREAARVRGKAGTHVPLSEELAEQIESTHPQPEAEVVRVDRDRRLWRAFADLPQRCQELLRLTVLGGRAEYRLVAEELQIPRGSIGPNRGRCLNVLRTLLEDTEGGAR